MEEIGVIAYKSKINPDYQVHIVYNNYAEYDLIKKSLSEMNNSIGHFGTIRNTLGMSTKVSTAGGDPEEEEEEKKDPRAYSPSYPPTHTHTLARCRST